MGNLTAKEALEISKVHRPEALAKEKELKAQRDKTSLKRVLEGISSRAAEGYMYLEVVSSFDTPAYRNMPSYADIHAVAKSLEKLGYTIFYDRLISVRVTWGDVNGNP